MYTKQSNINNFRIKAPKFIQIKVQETIYYQEFVKMCTKNIKKFIFTYDNELNIQKISYSFNEIIPKMWISEHLYKGFITQKS